MNLKKLVCASMFISSAACAQTINVLEADFQPELDGSAGEWSSVEATELSLKNYKPGGKSDISSVNVKAVRKKDMVYLLLQWKDATKDDIHKPFVWDQDKGKYSAGKQREDRLAIQFAMDGDYSTNWMSGKEFVADMWHWKAGRSNPVGLVHDKRTIISKVSAKKAYKAKAQDGSIIYIRRPGDDGDKLYSTKRYKEKKDDMMPKYILNKKASGSVADIKAKGVWADGMWTLEIARKLDTGHPDDVVFATGKSVKGGIAVFNSTGDNDHNTSNELTFQF